MTAYLGMILPVGFNFAPKGWNICAGQILSIPQNQALFALLGTNYGGNGTTNFALPDLRGRAPIGYGNGADVPPYIIGQQGGATAVTVLASNLPPHNHLVRCAAAGNTGTAAGNYPANTTDTSNAPQIGFISDSAQASNTLNPAAVATAGNNVPVSLMPPYLAINYVICMSGIFPSKS